MQIEGYILALQWAIIGYADMHTKLGHVICNCHLILSSVPVPSLLVLFFSSITNGYKYCQQNREVYLHIFYCPYGFISDPY